jgi:hypothetical protein
VRHVDQVMLNAGREQPDRGGIRVDLWMEVVRDHDLVTLFDEAGDGAGADEATSAGDENCRHGRAV